MGYFDIAIAALRRGLSLGGDSDAAASMTRELSVALVITRQFEAASQELFRFLSRNPAAWPALIADAVTFMASLPAGAAFMPLSHETSRLLVDFGKLLIKLDVDQSRKEVATSVTKRHKITVTQDAPYVWAAIAKSEGQQFAAKAASAAANLLSAAASTDFNVPSSTREQTWNVLGHFLHEVGGDRVEAMMALGTASRLRDEKIAGAMSAPDLAEHVRATAQAETPSSTSKKSALSGMKVFVYSLPPVWNTVMQGLNTDQCRYSIYGAEIFIHEQLIMSPYVTRNASEATHFYVPFYSSCMMSSRFVRPGPGRPNNDVDIGDLTAISTHHLLAHLLFRRGHARSKRSSGFYSGIFSLPTASALIIFIPQIYLECTSLVQYQRRPRSHLAFHHRLGFLRCALKQFRAFYSSRHIRRCCAPNPLVHPPLLPSICRPEAQANLQMQLTLRLQVQRSGAAPYGQFRGVRATSPCTMLHAS